ERSIDGTPKKFKKGAAILAAHLKVPIYPVAIEGFYDAWPRHKKFMRLSRLRIRFGDPIYPPETLQNPEETYRSLTEQLRSRVVEMWEGLRGKEAVSN
ncbi:MAG: 1-acyl-sn-glycerol-3-phosphate acyltransferase, partial [Acidobacteriia bacterium]|nr:1-acyl-sn-glycerol-3-phosphate acyltransferase [Terriglobia bacterium]